MGDASAHASAAEDVLRGEVHRGDAFKLIGGVPDSSIDLVITSPPYWGLRSYGLQHNEGILEEWSTAGCAMGRVPPYEWYQHHGGLLGLEPFPEWYVVHLVEFFIRARRVLRASGSMWVNLGDTYFARWSSVRDDGRQGIAGERQRRRTPSGGYLHDKQLLMIPARFAIGMQEAGWILRNDLIWTKPHPIPRPEADRLRLSHEHWFHFVLRRPGGRPRYYYKIDESEDGAFDVVSCRPSTLSNGHSATFPADLVRRRIATSSPPDGAVLDPFCGTGTALVEALRLGRRVVGFELSPGFASRAKKELAAVSISANVRETYDGRQ